MRYHVVQIDVTIDLAREFLFEGPGCRIIADHRSPEGHDFVNRQEVAQKPPRCHEGDCPTQAVSSNPKRAFSGLLRLVDRGKKRLPHHGKCIQKAPVKSRTYARRGELCPALAFWQDQVVVGVRQQPILQPVECVGASEPRKATTIAWSFSAT